LQGSADHCFVFVCCKDFGLHGSLLRLHSYSQIAYSRKQCSHKTVDGKVLPNAALFLSLTRYMGFLNYLLRLHPCYVGCIFLNSITDSSPLSADQIFTISSPTDLQSDSQCRSVRSIPDVCSHMRTSISASLSFTLVSGRT